MCRESESIAAVNAATDALAQACWKLCPDDIELALRLAYDKVAAEEVPHELTDLIARLQ